MLEHGCPGGRGLGSAATAQLASARGCRVAPVEKRCIVGGATGVTLERWSPGLACTYAMILPMIWATGFDTGVVFCRRLDFAGLGGYDESRLAVC
jgi:hypothetical protein